MFKIFSPVRERFSNGGEFPSFNRNGKFWNTITILKSHLNQKPYLTSIMKTIDLYDENDVVIEYKLVEVKRTPVKEWMKEHEKNND